MFSHFWGMCRNKIIRKDCCGGSNKFPMGKFIGGEAWSSKGLVTFIDQPTCFIFHLDFLNHFFRTIIILHKIVPLFTSLWNVISIKECASTVNVEEEF